MKKFVYFLLISILWLQACQDESAEYPDLPQNTENEKMLSLLNTPNESELSPQIIKYGELYFKTDNFQEDLNFIKNILKQFNAKIISENQENNDYYLSAELQIKIEAQKFDSLVNYLTNSKLILTIKNISKEDVTTEIIDYQTRLKNKKALEEQYLTILKQANTISDILEVNKYLQEVRSEIETMEAQLNYLQNQVKYSTLKINLSQEKSYINNEKFNFLKKLKNTTKDTWHLFLNFIILVIALTPFWLFLIFVVFVWKKIKNKRK